MTPQKLWTSFLNRVAFKRGGCPKTLRSCETLAFAFGLRSRSKTRCFKTRVLGKNWRLPHGKPQERLRFRDLRSKTQGVPEKRIAIV